MGSSEVCDRPEPEGPAGAGDDGREVRPAEGPDLRGVALVTVPDLHKSVSVLLFGPTWHRGEFSVLESVKVECPSIKESEAYLTLLGWIALAMVGICRSHPPPPHTPYLGGLHTHSFLHTEVLACS